MIDIGDQKTILSSWLDCTEFLHDNLIEAREFCNAATTQYDREDR